MVLEQEINDFIKLIQPKDLYDKGETKGFIVPELSEFIQDFIELNEVIVSDEVLDNFHKNFVMIISLYQKLPHPTDGEFYHDNGLVDKAYSRARRAVVYAYDLFAELGIEDNKSRVHLSLVLFLAGMLYDADKLINYYRLFYYTANRKMDKSELEEIDLLNPSQACWSLKNTPYFFYEKEEKKDEKGKKGKCKSLESIRLHLFYKYVDSFFIDYLFYFDELYNQFISSWIKDEKDLDQSSLFDAYLMYINADIVEVRKDCADAIGDNRFSIERRIAFSTHPHYGDKMPKAVNVRKFEAMDRVYHRYFYKSDNYEKIKKEVICKNYNVGKKEEKPINNHDDLEAKKAVIQSQKSNEVYQVNESEISKNMFINAFVNFIKSEVRSGNLSINKSEESLLIDVENNLIYVPFYVAKKHAIESERDVESHLGIIYNYINKRVNLSFSVSKKSLSFIEFNASLFNDFLNDIGLVKHDLVTDFNSLHVTKSDYISADDRKNNINQEVVATKKQAYTGNEILPVGDVVDLDF